MQKFHFLPLTLLLLISCQNSSKKTTEVDSLGQDTIVTPDTITLLFAGDIMQHDAQLIAAKTPNGYDYSSYFEHIKDELQAADLSIGNLETPVGKPPYRGYPMFNAPPALAAECKNSGFDILLTANNHSVDRYGKGILNTILTLDSLEIDHIGTYRNIQERDSLHPFIKEVRGLKIAFLNYTYGTNGLKVPAPYIVNPIDTQQIKKDLKIARQKGADLNLVCIHWGVEYANTPSKEQKRLAKWLFENGADHIIGSHPHVIQPIETFEDTITGKRQTVAYSLGNVISNSPVENAGGGMLFKMRFYKKEGRWESESSYSLFWVGRPSLTNEKNYTLYPISSTRPKLNSESLNNLNIFEKGAHKVMQENSSDIKKWEM